MRGKNHPLFSPYPGKVKINLTLPQVELVRLLCGIQLLYIATGKQPVNLGDAVFRIDNTVVFHTLMLIN